MRIFFVMITAVTLFLQSHSSFAAQMFTPEEFGSVSNAAVAQFKVDMPSMFGTFFGVTLTRNIVNSEEVGILAKVYTKADANSAPIVMSKYNCLKHDGNTLVCHEAS